MTDNRKNLLRLLQAQVDETMGWENFAKQSGEINHKNLASHGRQEVSELAKQCKLAGCSDEEINAVLGGFDRRTQAPQREMGCCGQCVDPEHCLVTRFERLKAELKKLTCPECGNAKFEQERVCIQCGSDQCWACGTKYQTKIGEEGDDVSEYCPNPNCSTSPYCEGDEPDEGVLPNCFVCGTQMKEDWDFLDEFGRPMYSCPKCCQDPDALPF